MDRYYRIKIINSTQERIKVIVHFKETFFPQTPKIYCHQYHCSSFTIITSLEREKNSIHLLLSPGGFIGLNLYAGTKIIERYEYFEFYFKEIKVTQSIQDIVTVLKLKRECQGVDAIHGYLFDCQLKPVNQSLR